MVQITVHHKLLLVAVKDKLFVNNIEMEYTEI